MTDAIFGVYGASGYGREVMPLARAQLVLKGIAPSQLFFIDDAPQTDIVNGQRVVSYADFLGMRQGECQVVLAIANSAVREKLAMRLDADGVGRWTVAAANAISLDDVTLGEGAVLSPFVTLTSNIRIGRHFHANIYSYVAHDCIVGDFVTFAPGVKCNGNVRIEDHAYIGTGAVIKQGSPGRPLTIGKGAIVGMGAVVTRDVPAGMTVVGNPAKPFTSRQ
ncbi:MAG: acetyltransferase [Proteobacteria bacterium]|nr:MAG: acetyltransferase [Pseudomonadota bacterium]